VKSKGRRSPSAGKEEPKCGKEEPKYRKKEPPQAPLYLCSERKRVGILFKLD